MNEQDPTKQGQAQDKDLSKNEVKEKNNSEVLDAKKNANETVTNSSKDTPNVKQENLANSAKGQVLTEKNLGEGLAKGTKNTEQLGKQNINENLEIGQKNSQNANAAVSYTHLMVFAHPFIDRQSPVVTADYVTLEQGSGCVHTAPGHGQDDFETGMRCKLPIISPVDASGKFTSEAGKYEGMLVHDANAVSYTHLYVEFDAPPINNLSAVEDIIRHMKASDIDVYKRQMLD